VTRLETRFLQNGLTRDSRLDLESFLQNLWVPGGQTQLVYTQRNEDLLLQWCFSDDQDWEFSVFPV